MKCLFCLTKLFAKFEAQGYSTYNCINCKAFFQYSYLSKSINKYWFYCEYKGIHYGLQFDTNEDDKLFRIFSIGNAILILHEIPNITPFNFKEKLKLYLLFS